MKKNFKRLAICLAVVAVATTGLLLTSSRTEAQVNPDCPNGCVRGSTCCECNGLHQNLDEASTEVVISRPTK